MAGVKRREANFWEAFNVWWRETWRETGRKPRGKEVSEWYVENAVDVWPDAVTRPSLDITKHHANGIRDKEQQKQYFRSYRSVQKILDQHQREKQGDGSQAGDSTQTGESTLDTKQPPAPVGLQHLVAMLTHQDRQASFPDRRDAAGTAGGDADNQGEHSGTEAAAARPSSNPDFSKNRQSSLPDISGNPLISHHGVSPGYPSDLGINWGVRKVRSRAKRSKLCRAALLLCRQMDQAAKRTSSLAFGSASQAKSPANNNAASTAPLRALASHLVSAARTNPTLTRGRPPTHPAKLAAMPNLTQFSLAQYPHPYQMPFANSYTAKPGLFVQMS